MQRMKNTKRETCKVEIQWETTAYENLTDGLLFTQHRSRCMEDLFQTLLKEFLVNKGDSAALKSTLKTATR